MQPTAAVQMRNITKTFGRVRANQSVSLDIKRGEILSLLGENGSGKTTLMNMLSGIYHQDSGEIFVDGELAKISSPKDAYSYGIGMIHQHFKLVEILTAAENVILGLDEFKWLNMEIVAGKISEICQKYDFNIDPHKKVYEMSVSEKQTLEIVKALYRGAEILILDEPTAVLTPQETRKLFDVLRAMRADNKAVVIITHKLNEVMELADRVAVLRKGEYVGEMMVADTNPQEMTNMMVGHTVTLNIDRPMPKNVKERLTVKNLTVVGQDGVTKLSDVSFSINSGEILGIAGIAGSGQKELLESIAGLQPIKEGSIMFYPEGKEPSELVGKSPMKIKEAGVALAFVPEDRLGMGLVGGMGMTGNMMLRSWRKGRGIFLQKSDPEHLAGKIMNDLEVVTPNVNYPVRKLSGGNVQKVLVGREIASAPSVLMTAYAVRGLDINTSYTIYNLLTEQKMKGAAVVYVGEDLDVLLELCDRILVICDGQVSGIVDARTITKDEIGLMMINVPDKEAQTDDTTC